MDGAVVKSGTLVNKVANYGLIFSRFCPFIFG